MQPSPYWGDETIWDSKANNHNSMLDKQGRVWLAAAVRGRRQSGLLQDRAPIIRRRSCSRWSAASRQLAMFDPKTKKYTFVDTCFGDPSPAVRLRRNDTLWTSGGGPVVGWLNTKMFDETGDAAQSQGWTALVLDTNGNGKRDDYVEPNQPVDPTQGQAHHRRLLCGDAEPGGRLGLGLASAYSGSAVVRLDPRSESAGDRARRNLQRADARLRHARRRHRQAGRRVGVARQRPPRQLRPAQVQGPAQRTEGDRRSLSGGLDVLPVSRARLQGIGENSAESSYYTWVDQHNTFGLGDERADVDRQPERRPASRSRTAR